MMSRPLTDVATLLPLLHDVATTSDSVLMSRPLLISVDVATSFRCRDFYVQSLENLMSRLLFGVTTFMSTALPLILSRP